MKQYKLDVINELVRRSKEEREISIKDAALAVGVDRLYRQEIEEIVRKFVQICPTYRPVIIQDPNHPDLWSFWENCVVTEHEYLTEEQVLSGEGL